MIVFLSIILSSVATIVALYHIFGKRQDFFEKHGIPHVPPSPVFGNMGPLIRQRQDMHQMLQEPYERFSKAKYFGFYEMSTPEIVLRDLDLIKAVTTKNFEHFQDHRPFVNDKTDPLFNGNLFSLKGDQWKDERSVLSPMFTSSKIKSMFNLMTACAVRFTGSLMKLVEKEPEIEMKNVLTMYTNDVIASCVYGVDMDTMNDPKNILYAYGRAATNFTGFKQSLILLVHRNAPKLAELFKIRFVSSRISKFFKDMVAEIVKERQENGTYRPDMIQLMMDANNKKESGKGLPVDNMAAHAFGFFFGGLDTVSSQVAFVFQVMAEYPDIQARLQMEIDEALERTNGRLTYEVVQEMKYLDAVISETMRFYPLASFLDRTCTKRFELPPALPDGKPFTVEPGMNLWIPVMPIHMDPNYYENPRKFDPDRFMDDGKKILNSCIYLPFGVGPRMCIGSRFALIKMKVLICYLLARCNVKAGAKTSIPMELKKGFTAAMPKNGFWVKLEPRKNPHPSLAKGVNG